MDKMMDKKIPKWLEGKQLSDEALAELREVEQPIALLGELPDNKVPDYLYPLVLAARILNGFAIYDPASDKARALWAIEWVREKLKDAERRCRE